MHIRNSFGVSFARQLTIRRKANEFEDILKEQSSQPQIISVPDGLDPEVPRMIFGSKHGFSKIIVSQVNVTLNVTYSPDWQEDISKGKQYLLKRVPILFNLLVALEDAKPCFCGLVSLVRLPSIEEERKILDCMAELSGRGPDLKNLLDIHLKTTTIISDRFFSNMTLKNYRMWKDATGELGPQPRPIGKASERGIEIIGDFNDRHMFNESSTYFSNPDAAKDIIHGALAEIQGTVGKIRGLEI